MKISKATLLASSAAIFNEISNSLILDSKPAFFNAFFTCMKKNFLIHNYKM